MKKLINIIVSTRFTGVLLLVFALAMAVATFVENDFGTQSAKALIYNAAWFEWVMVLLALNFVGNIKRYRLWSKEKWPVLMFHVAFILIILGAGVTRYISYEGVMHIREGETVDYIISDNTFLEYRVDNNEVQKEYEHQLLLSTLSNNDFSLDDDFKGVPFEINYVNYIPHAEEFIEEVEGGEDILHLVSSNNAGRQNLYLKKGEVQTVNGLLVSYDKQVGGAINIQSTESGWTIKAPFDTNMMRMADQHQENYAANAPFDFFGGALYNIGGLNLVLKATHESAKLSYRSAEDKQSNLPDMLVVDVQVNDAKERVELLGGKGFINPRKQLSVGDLNFYLAYGSKQIKTPFQVMLRDFQLDRYPGSNSPSSFASEITVIDKAGVSTDHRIYMNNVLDMEGYRMFQSSYDNDEMGTVLSVNHDWWGTLITYAGYFFMMLGMFFTLFTPKSRFMDLNRKLKKLDDKGTLKKKAAVLGALLLIGQLSFAQHEGHQHGNGTSIMNPYENVDSLIQAQSIPADHAAKFGRLIVQDQGGRLKPVNTMSSEILRKVYRKDNYQGLNSDQVLLGMLQDPIAWQFMPILRLGRDEEVHKSVGINEKYARFFDMFDEQGRYKLSQYVEQAYQKKPGARNTFDNEIIKLDERVNVLYMVFQGNMMRLFPLPNDVNNKWYSYNDHQAPFVGKDSLFVNKIMPWYFSEIRRSKDSGDWSGADEKVKFISSYQTELGASVYPDSNKVEWEIVYNEQQPFAKLYKVYLLVGFVMLMALFAGIFKERKWLNYFVKGLAAALFLAFAVHTGALGVRWFISGHAPWSNGYESMIYIGWATVLAGFIFAKRSMIALSATAILAALILFVADLNWLDPEITPLVPVLQSYWLMIHVAIITASYGFLALGAILGFINLSMMIFTNENNKPRMTATVKELSYINEMTLTVGLFMLAVGTFLGGIWANESWGRYWGWDPKETWALISVIVYSFVLHMRLIPGLRGNYAFNLASVISFSSIIMTYFGVNYYLSGMHSYAKGDPMPVPTFVYYTVMVVTVVAVAAYYRNRQMKVKGVEA